MIARDDIEQFSRELAREFRPRRIVLFGSHANGQTRPDSDVDLLVTMEYTGNSRHVAAKIIRRLKPRFAVDLVVRREQEVAERVREHDFFLTEALKKGRVLHEAVD
jgi:predicted nucleotidyltransferase